ncbi:permease [Agaricicola taiwanensis]|uniref:Permease n=1 Tax=Agaricicola taiwanensis TaxID=591372 RepID=A0A8J3DZ65_9RHOB|nr:AEC family transporter [Agaricicola taiwanensis]GGE50805.1 permease [Agaricicola taiwanensis]
MTDILAIILPVFGLIFLGFFAVKTGILSPSTGEGLSDYVFALAVPALIFRTLSTNSLPNTSPWGYWIAYFAGVAVVWPLAMLLARRVFGRSSQEAVVHGFAAGQSNTVLVGIPLILAAYGEAGAVPLFLLIAIHLPVMMTLGTLNMEATGGISRAGFLRLLRILATHPILLALIAGLIASWLSLSIPETARTIIDGLGASASPVALVAMGITLARYGLKGEIATATTLTFLKLMVHPFAVWILAHFIFGLEPVFTGVAVLFASMPCGINGYLLAARYKTGEAVASGAITISTALSVITVAFWLWVLGVG